MQKVLVTGATGFIGNYVIQELLKNNVQVIATSTSEEKAKRFSWYPSVQYFVFDIKDYNAAINYYDYFQQPTHLIHLAWEGLPNYTSAFHYEENLPRHYQFLQNIINNGLRDLTVAGTCLEYGMKEGQLREDDVVEPSNYYAQAKNQLRLQLEQLNNPGFFSLKWVRLFFMYGEGQNSKSLLSQLQHSLDNEEEVFNMSKGEQVRDFLPVEEVAKNIVRVAMQNKVTGVINCSSNKPITVKQLVEDYLVKKNKHIKLNLGYYPYPTYEPMEFWGDNSKLKSITDG
jgi:dTDP-6-deoxy-L-talose 4-dehydrogenase (NAD+)